MDLQDFRKEAHEIVDFLADYFENIESYPVKSQVKPKDIFSKLPDLAPEEPETMNVIMEDLNSIIMPGLTHWQSPKFHAYFPANNSYPSILAEFLTAGFGAQCMVWETSPAAAELEEQVMIWLRDMIGLPKQFEGVIQDTASTATLIAILTAREKSSNFDVNEKGFSNHKYRIYCSSEAHSSIEKAVKIAGIGKSNLIKIPVDDNFSLLPDELEKAIKQDLMRGFKPLCVVSALGTTGSTAVDPIRVIAKITKKYNIWHHVDAAFAGSALILPEYRQYLDGIEDVDSFVFNPHKWLFTNFDCSAYFIQDEEALIRTFEVLPEYLKTKVDTEVNNYRDWGIALGRRFRALKLWFVIRTYGVKGLQKTISNHINYAKQIEKKIIAHPDFELLAPVNFNTICFRYNSVAINDENQINDLNKSLLEKINSSGESYLTHTKLNEKYTLRLVLGQTYLEEEHVNQTWELILKYKNEL